jgi:hypothetical protein
MQQAEILEHTGPPIQQISIDSLQLNKISSAPSRYAF